MFLNDVRIVARAFCLWVDFFLQTGYILTGECKMVGKQKILLMTKLAVYDKHDGPSDRAANDYFRHDYIYRKNLGTRLAVGIGGLIILAFYWLRVIFIDGADVFEMYFQTYITNSVVFLLALLAFYTLVGTIKGTRDYFLVQKRLEKYDRIVKHLERIDERGRKRAEVEKELEEFDEPKAEKRTTARSEALKRRDNIRTSLSPRRSRPAREQSRPTFTMNQTGDTKPRPTVGANKSADSSRLVRRQNPTQERHD